MVAMLMQARPAACSMLRCAVGGAHAHTLLPTSDLLVALLARWSQSLWLAAEEPYQGCGWGQPKQQVECSQATSVPVM